MRWIGYLALLFVLLSTARAESGPTVALHRLEIGGSVYTLRTSTREVTLAHNDGCLIHYTVRRDGKVVHPRDWDGGRLVGCSYNRCETDLHRVKPFPDAKTPRGWVITVGAWCGNTHGKRHRIVLPPIKERGAYRELTIRSKAGLTLRHATEGLEIWGSDQDWGDGGTSTSIFVPFRVLLNDRGEDSRPPLPADPKAWPKLEIDSGAFGWFVAGLDTWNAAVMRAALARWGDLEKHEDWLRGFGLPSKRAKLEALIEAVEDVARARDRVETLRRRDD